MKPRIYYAICTNPRSGSWLLSEGLESTNVAGRPREWFHDSTEEEVCRRTGIPPPSQTGNYASYLAQLETAATTGNGVFGVKLHYYQFTTLSAKLRTVAALASVPMPQLLNAAFPEIKHVWLTRRDKVRQAVSYHKACQTDAWWQKEGLQPPRRPGTVSEPSFDPHNIERLENLLAANEQNWQTYFQQAGVEPLVIFYEDLAADYAGVIRQVVGWLGVPCDQSFHIPPPALVKQADSVNEQWIERYLQFKAGRSTVAIAGLVGPPDETVIPAPWKRWIGENKLVKTSDAAIVDVLVKNGFSPAAAAAEVNRAGSDPYLQAGEWFLQRLNKLQSLLAAYRAVADLHPNAGIVERRIDVTRQEFLERYYAANRPVILRGLMSGWKAMTSWTPEYLKQVLGHEEIEIMFGRNADPNYEINAGQHRRRMPFGNYLDLVESGDATNDYYLVANNGFFKQPAASRLLNDIECFSEYLDPERLADHVFFWYGPSGTVTPLHHDTSNIFMAQVRGRKRVRLISPNDSEFLYNDIGVFSPVDCDAPDLNRWPQYRKARVIEVDLQPGEVLFLPVGWWHHVRAIDVSLTISFTNFLFPNRYEWMMPQIRK